MQDLIPARFQRGGTKAGERVDHVHEARLGVGAAEYVRDGAYLQVALADGRKIVAGGGERVHMLLDEGHFPRRDAHDLRGEQALGGDAILHSLHQRVVAEAFVRRMLVNEQEGILTFQEYVSLEQYADHSVRRTLKGDLRLHGRLHLRRRGRGEGRLRRRWRRRGRRKWRLAQRSVFAKSQTLTLRGNERVERRSSARALRRKRDVSFFI